VSKRWPEKTVIGLTGNIATGKSVVRRMLEHLGAFGIDADGLAHRAMSPGAPAHGPVVEMFGRWVLTPDGQINRPRLANIVFSDLDALAVLEQITHPIVNQVIDLLIRRSKQNVVVIEAIKLFEAGLADNCDAAWVVDALPEVQLRRLVDERKMDEAVAQKRIAAQPPQVDKLTRATHVIHNSGSYEYTWDQVQEAYNDVMGIVHPPEAEEKPQPVAEKEAGGVIPADAIIASRRGGPAQAGEIASFYNRLDGATLNRNDVLVRFGQKAYMLCYGNEELLGLAGWQVENLIARVDEFRLAANAPVERVVPTLVGSIERAASDLQSEIVLLFLRADASRQLQQTIVDSGYEVKTAADLLVPDWREAARDSAPPDSLMLFKRLREDRVLKPI
jgi:dephospho-CoA kinase